VDHIKRLSPNRGGLKRPVLDHTDALQFWERLRLMRKSISSIARDCALLNIWGQGPLGSGPNHIIASVLSGSDPIPSVGSVNKVLVMGLHTHGGPNLFHTVRLPNCLKVLKVGDFGFRFETHKM